jgi:DNA-binding IclR family transcriptional regulator
MHGRNEEMSDSSARPGQLADRRRPAAAQTAGTITDPAALHAEIALTRARGYALDESGMEIGVRCVAVGMPGRAPMAVSGCPRG